MKRFSFRLERVMRVREIERDMAQATLVKARRAEAAARHRAEVMQEQAASECFQPGTTMTTSEVRSMAFRASMRARAAEIAMLDLAKAEQQSAEEGKVLYLASQKVDAMGRLKVRHRETWEVDARREEAVVLDDISTTRAARVRAEVSEG